MIKFDPFLQVFFSNSDEPHSKGKNYTCDILYSYHQLSLWKGPIVRMKNQYWNYFCGNEYVMQHIFLCSVRWKLVSTKMDLRRLGWHLPRILELTMCGFNPVEYWTAIPGIRLSYGNTGQFHQVFGSDRRIHHWLLSEGTKFNPVGVGATSAHAKWLTMLTGISCDMWEKTEMPVILYSKLPGPNYLSTLGRRITVSVNFALECYLQKGIAGRRQEKKSQWAIFFRVVSKGRDNMTHLSSNIWVFLNVFTESSEFSEKLFVIPVKGLESATRLRPQHQCPPRHAWETGSSNWSQFMLRTL